jgi:hypothetical protein
MAKNILAAHLSQSLRTFAAQKQVNKTNLMAQFSTTPEGRFVLLDS